jgi:hypothetical protein
LQQGLSLFGNLLPLLRKLDAAELAVCTAIAQVTTEKMQTLLLPTPPGASEEEIVEHFVNQGKKPPVKVS